jgi:5-formyltetrahydrofolate cyclo-ligase
MDHGPLPGGEPLPNPPSQKTKQDIRIQIKAMAQAFSPQDILQKSLDICRRAEDSGILTQARKLLFFMAAKGEPHCQSLMEKAWALGKETLLPVCQPSSRGLALYSICCWSQIGPGAFGLQEPLPEKRGQPSPPSALDLAFIPGVAFDLQGNRLGHGGGYFDRLLPLLRPNAPVIALAFDFQVLKRLPQEPHDRPVHQIITETRHIFCGNGAL